MLVEVPRRRRLAPAGARLLHEVSVVVLAPPEEQRADGLLATGSAGEVRILIVDDDRLMTDFLPRKLAKAVGGVPLRFLTASSPEEGIRLLSEKPHVVLCDYNLRAAMTGLDVLAAAATAAPDSLRILFSGHTSREIGGDLASAPIHGFVEKPMRLDDMVPHLVSLMERLGAVDPQRSRGG